MMQGNQKKHMAKMFRSDEAFSNAESENESLIKKSAFLSYVNTLPDYKITIEEAIKEAFPQDADTILMNSRKQYEAMKYSKAIEVYKNINEAKALAITAYTLDLGKENYESNPYRVMNKVLAARDTNKLRAIKGFSLYLLSALRSMEPVPNSKSLFRGIDGKFINWDTHKVGNKLSWPAFTSTTTDTDNIEDFLSKSVMPVVFEIKGEYRGYSVRLFSLHEEEEEVILEPETNFVIKEIKDDNEIDGAKRIVVEVVPSTPILDRVVRNFNATNNPGYDLLLPESSSASSSSAAAATTAMGTPNNSTGMFSPAQPQQRFSGPQMMMTTTPPVPTGPVLPPNWVQRIDTRTGRVYYANTITRTTQWEFPSAQQQQQPQQPQQQQQQQQQGYGSQFTNQSGFGMQMQQQQQQQQPQQPYNSQFMNQGCFGLQMQQQQPQQQNQFQGGFGMQMQQQQQQQQQPQQPQQQQQQNALPMCSEPFTCTKVRDHKKQFRHACLKELSECPRASDPEHMRTTFHLVKQECNNPNCQEKHNPAHRFMYSHRGLDSFMLPCRNQNIESCPYRGDENHLLSCYHSGSNFAFPQQFNYQ